MTNSSPKLNIGNDQPKAENGERQRTSSLPKTLSPLPAIPQSRGNAVNRKLDTRQRFGVFLGGAVAF